MGYGTRRAARLAKQRQALPPNPVCGDCGGRRLASLTMDGDQVRCYRCLRRRAGQPVIEQHHFLAAAVTPELIPVPANDHRAVEDIKRDFPARIWTNREGRVLPMTIAILAMAGALGYCLYRYAPRLARSLLHFDERQRGALGPGWEDAVGLAPHTWEDPTDTDPIV